MRKLQTVLACVVTKTTKYKHISPVRKKLHWLPIEYHVFKTALLVYKFLHSGTPDYFTPYIKPKKFTYMTCSSQSDGIILDLPLCTSHKSPKQFGNSFCFDAPSIWNNVPEVVCAATSLSSFRCKLKAHLFLKAYPP